MYSGPCLSSALTVCTTSAPAISALTTSTGVWTPPVAAS